MIPAGGSPPTVPELRSRVLPWVEQVLFRAGELGFLGAMPVDEQIDHALGFAFAAELALGGPPRAVLDLGTGGGVPGLVLVSCWPQAHVVLLDASQRRTEFLRSETDRWVNSEAIEVMRGRAEEVGREARLRERFDLVTARSFGSPGVTGECGAPFVARGGVLVVSEPPGPPGAGRWPVEGLTKVGLEVGEQQRFDQRFGYQVLVKAEGTSDRYPRRVGQPAKRPLF